MRLIQFGILALSVLTGCSSENSHWKSQVAAVVQGDSVEIRCADAPMTDQQLTDLVKLDGKLLDLLVDRGGISDQNVQSIARIRSLEHLRIRESQLSDAALDVLAKGNLRSLRILNLPQSAITARGIEYLRQFPALTQLRLGGPQLTDEAALAIAGLPALKSLHLIGPKLSDEGLRHLATAPHLASLYIDDCPLSDEAWEKVFELKPGLHVHIDQSHHDRDPNAHSH